MINISDEDYRVFSDTMHTLQAMPEIQRLKNFRQHGDNTTYQHVCNVANCAFYTAQKHHLKVDIVAMTTAAMFHDYYLYDTRDMLYSDYQHALLHPRFSVANVSKFYPLTDLEKEIILSHMWPIPGSPWPKSTEAKLVCYADTYVAALEMGLGRHMWVPRNMAMVCC
ncbi:MAG: hypothetical protein ACOX8B_03500 [Lachnospiraceae bacterium]